MSSLAASFPRALADGSAIRGRTLVLVFKQPTMRVSAVMVQGNSK